VDKDAIEDIREITAVDRGMLELKDAVENMHAQIDNIQHRMEE
jgi:charged multivesicular body protein 7